MKDTCPTIVVKTLTADSSPAMNIDEFLRFLSLYSVYKSNEFSVRETNAPRAFTTIIEMLLAMIPLSSLNGEEYRLKHCHRSSAVLWFTGWFIFVVLFIVEIIVKIVMKILRFL